MRCLIRYKVTARDLLILIIITSTDTTNGDWIFNILSSNSIALHSGFTFHKINVECLFSVVIERLSLFSLQTSTKNVTKQKWSDYNVTSISKCWIFAFSWNHVGSLQFVLCRSTEISYATYSLTKRVVFRIALFGRFPFSSWEFSALKTSDNKKRCWLLRCQSTYTRILTRDTPFRHVSCETKYVFVVC